MQKSVFSHKLDTICLMTSCMLTAALVSAVIVFFSCYSQHDVAALLYGSPHGWLQCRYVLLKERNMLASEQGRRKARGEKLPNPTRITKVCINLPGQHKQQNSF